MLGLVGTLEGLYFLDFPRGVGRHLIFVCRVLQRLDVKSWFEHGPGNIQVAQEAVSNHVILHIFEV